MSQQVRERFDATFWDFLQVVAWICYRTPEHLDEFVLSPRRARWYGCGAYAVLRRAIERGEVTGFDEDGRGVKPAAVLRRDPKIYFDSRAIKARWTPSCSMLADEAAASAKQAGNPPDRPTVEIAKGEAALNVTRNPGSNAAGAKKAWKAKLGAKPSRSGTAILEALNNIWPDGFLDHKASGRDRRISDWLKAKHSSSVSPRTIQRELRKIEFA